MLVLSRKEGQRIVIGSDIEILVAQVCGNRVKLGISAPHEVPVHREEILERVRNETGGHPVLELETDRSQFDNLCCE